MKPSYNTFQPNFNSFEKLLISSLRFFLYDRLMDLNIILDFIISSFCLLISFEFNTDQDAADYTSTQITEMFTFQNDS